MASPTHHRLVDSPGILRPMLALALPVLLEQVLHLGVQYVDFYLTGNFLDDQAYLAAMIAVLIGMFLVYRFFPNKDDEEALRADYHSRDGSGRLLVPRRNREE